MKPSPIAASEVFDISIPLQFGGPQPNAFGAPRAAAETLGDTRRGASVNFETYRLTPHCNGTHTECVGHITDERISLTDCLKDVLVRARLVSVEPVRVASGDLIGDLVINLDSIRSRLGDLAEVHAVVVRTLPNSETKLSAAYDDRNVPPYFDADAAAYLAESGVVHLLVDLPSIDRIVDEGRLRAHRAFWRIADGSRQISNETRRNATITELIYVPDNVPDGDYLLNLQIPPFQADAAPSRPLLLTNPGI